MTDYQGMFNSCVITKDPGRLRQIDYVCRIALSNQTLYQAVQFGAKVPWPAIAAIHFRESNQHFGCHLHNGDPLTARTVHVPAGRPRTGNPPFRWQDSAIDALAGYWRPDAWDLAGTLEYLERYNGLGYQKHGVNTPYLWDYTDKYTSGLYKSDRSFDPGAHEIRPGAVALLKAMAARGVSLDFSGVPACGPVVH